jgi:hypothetical protein
MNIIVWALFFISSTAAFVLPFSIPIKATRSSWMALRMTASSPTKLGKPGTAELDTPWEELGFEFRPTKSHVRIVYRNGEWGPMELVEVSFIV